MEDHIPRGQLEKFSVKNLDYRTEISWSTKDSIHTQEQMLSSSNSHGQWWMGRCHLSMWGEDAATVAKVPLNWEAFRGGWMWEHSPNLTKFRTLSVEKRPCGAFCESSRVGWGRWAGTVISHSAVKPRGHLGMPASVIALLPTDSNQF